MFLLGSGQQPLPACRLGQGCEDEDPFLHKCSVSFKNMSSCDAGVVPSNGNHRNLCVGHVARTLRQEHGPEPRITCSGAAGALPRLLDGALLCLAKGPWGCARCARLLHTGQSV